MSIKQGNKIIAGTPDLTNYATKEELKYYQTKFPLLTYQYSDHILNDIQWLRADTFSWQSGRVYESAYTHLLTDYINAEQKNYFYSLKNCYQVNTLANDNGVLNGFNVNSYVKFDNFSPENNTWEIVTKIRTNPSMSVGQIIFHLLTGSNDYNIGLWITTAGKLIMHASNNGTSWNLFNEILSTTVLLPNTVYYTKMNFTGEEYQMWLSMDGINWTLENSVANNNIIMQGKGIRFGSYIDGRPINAIDFKESYYKIGDNTYDMADYITIFKATDGHTLVDVKDKDKLNNWYNDYSKGYYYLIDTENYQFKLPRSKHGTVIEQKDYGSSGYRLYSDGYCEQWGTEYHTTGTSSVNGITINFFKEYADTNYTFTRLANNNSQTNGTATYALNYNTKYNSYITVGREGYSTESNWRTCGYVDIEKLENNQYKYLYFYVGNFNQSSIEQTAGLNAEDIANKVSKSSLVPVQSVVKTYRQGNGGYRLWSDGYCEQWGQIDRTAATMQISLYQKYDDNSYNIIVTPYHSSDIDGRPLEIQEGSKTPSSVDVIINTGYLGFYWRTCGYALGGLQ